MTTTNINMVLIIAESIIAVLLVAVILLQMQGSGLSGSFGGGGEFYRSKQSMDKLLVTITIVLAVSFAILSIILLIPQS